MTDVIEQNRELFKRHAEKDLPTADLADALLKLTDSDD